MNFNCLQNGAEPKQRVKSVLPFIVVLLLIPGCLGRNAATHLPDRERVEDTLQPNRGKPRLPDEKTPRLPGEENPRLLELALAELAGDKDFVLPKSEESYYRLVGGFPVIDRLGADPFSIPAFGMTVAGRLSGSGAAVELLTAAAAAMQVELFPLRRTARLAEKNLALEKQAEENLERGNLPDANPARILDYFPPRMEKAYHLCRDAASALTESELESLKNGLGSYFYEGEELVFLTAPVSGKASILNTVKKIDLKNYIRAELVLTAAADSSIDFLTRLSRDLAPVDGELLADAAYEWGRMLVGGTGRNKYSEDAALIIDLGGNDVYYNNAGGAGGEGPAAAMVIDLSGNDIYMPPPGRTVHELRPVAQGFGFLGAGLLVDLRGDDSYQAGDFSQGGGYLGCGMLLDCEGDDTYRGGRFVQGAGLFGFGVLADLAGDDAFSAEQLAQGFGSTTGAGILYDRNGDDRFEASSSSYGFAQGSGCGCRSYPWLMDFSLYGGIGFLVDDAGDDTYDAASFSQGASYFLSLGALVDRDGDDTYNGNGSYSHGAGVHLTSGLHLDLGGDDIYHGKWAGNAAGNDRSAGIFIDAEGDDSYSAPNGDGQAYSHKPRGFSLFIDASGDDTYSAANHSQGYVLPPIVPDAWGAAIFIDAGGSDSYSMPDRGNDKNWGSGTRAVGIDAETAACDPFADLERIALSRVEETAEEQTRRIPEEQSRRMGSSASLSPPGRSSPEPLKNSPDSKDPFSSLSRAGELAAKFRDDTAGLVYHLGEGDFATRRATEEALVTLLLGDSSEVPLPGYAGDALFAPDPKTRAFTAILIDLHKIDAAGARLLAAVSDPDPYVRLLVLRAIGSLEVTGGDSLLARIAEADPDHRCRGRALRSLAAYENPSFVPGIVAILENESEHVYTRFAAASALGRICSNAAAAADAGTADAARGESAIAAAADTPAESAAGTDIPTDTAAVADTHAESATAAAAAAAAALRKAASEPNPYLRKAAGEALLQLGDRSGLRPLIDYLDFRALDTSSDNYGSNIGAVLLEYTNVDFGRDRVKWLEWADENRDSFPLERNLVSRRICLEAARLRREGDETGALAAFENALSANPGYLKVRIEYASMLNNRAWGLVTSPSGETDAAEGLRLARRCVELDPKAMYIDTLAEACFRNGFLREAVQHEKRALELDPENTEFASRLERFREALQKE